MLMGRMDIFNKFRIVFDEFEFGSFIPFSEQYYKTNISPIYHPNNE